MPTQQSGTDPSSRGNSGSPSRRVFLQNLQSTDDEVRTAAWRSAGDYGASAVKPLAGLAGSDEPEVARAAMRGLWQIVRHSGRPGADKERIAVGKALIGLLSAKHPAQFRRDAVWMLSEIGADQSVKRIAALTDDPDLREDAVLALERIPGDASLHALQSALDDAPDDFKPAVAESLRRRGMDVSGIPSTKRTPSKPTAVKPL